MKKAIKSLFMSLALLTSTIVSAADYVIDTKGAHAFINFKVSHLGISWITGGFNEFEGTFSYDKSDITATKINVDINPASIDTNHAERDKHLRSGDFLNVDEYSTAKFVSTKVNEVGENNIQVTGDFTLNGVTNSITINANKIGEGKDPWGGYRVGFSGTTQIDVKDYNFKSAWVGKIELELIIEGIQKG